MQFEENVRKLEENWVPSRGESHTGISHSPRNLGENHWKIHFGTLRNAKKRPKNRPGKNPEKKSKGFGSIGISNYRYTQQHHWKLLQNAHSTTVRGLNPRSSTWPEEILPKYERIHKHGWMDGRTDA